MSTRDSDELIRARSLRSEADALVRIDEARRVLLHISGLLIQHPGDARLLAEEKALLVDISTHRAAAREAMRERGDIGGEPPCPHCGPGTTLNEALSQLADERVALGWAKETIARLEREMHHDGGADAFTIENGDMITVFSSSSIGEAMKAVDAEARIATEQGVQMTAWSGGRPVRFAMFREAWGNVDVTKWGHVDDTEDTEEDWPGAMGGTIKAKNCL